MPRSMTGFGSANGPVSGGHLEVEIRTVNHRHFNANLRLPDRLNPFESQLKELLRGSIERGHVGLTARWVSEPETELDFEVNVERARRVLDALSSLKEQLSLPGEIDLAFLARQPDLLKVADRSAVEIEFEEIEVVVTRALSDLIGMRESEGAALAQDLSERLTSMGDLLSEIEGLAPQRVRRERERLEGAVRNLLEGTGVDLNEDRIAQEIAILADKLDISEEIVRLRSHLGHAAQALESKGAVGKKLTFLAQEMLREVNTIGSKANDAGISERVIAMKGEMEKIREQLENLE